MEIAGRTLFAFVDLRDPYMPSAIANEEQYGPILSILAARQFDFLLLFFTPDARKNVDALRREVARRYSRCHVLLYEIPSHPKDYNSLTALLAYKVLEIRANSLRDSLNSVCVSSGTTEMRAAWFALTSLRILEATLLQVDCAADSIVMECQPNDKISHLAQLTMPGGPVLRLSRERFLWASVHGWLRKHWPVGRSVKHQRKQFEPSSLKDSGGWIASELEHDFDYFSAEDDSQPAVYSSEETAPPEPAGQTTLTEPLDRQVFTPFPALDKALKEIGLIVSSASLRFAAERAAIAAGTTVPVLLTGETGTGKELFARLVHRMSDRESKPMIIVNCAAIPKELAESHLFGHSKGAFTGATADTKGVFAAADCGTVFLDEVGELPLEIQAKFLRVLEGGSFTRLGSASEVSVDVRVIAATNRNLLEEVRAKRFREDLFYRLNVAQIDLPPLRERRSEIPELAIRFLERSNQRRRTPKQISKQALQRLQQYDWPGNVRELMHTIESSVLFSLSDVLEPDDLVINSCPPDKDSLSLLPHPREGFSIEEYVAQVRKQLFLRALDISKGNQAEAARILGVTKQAVWKFLNGYAADAS